MGKAKLQRTEGEDVPRAARAERGYSARNARQAHDRFLSCGAGRTTRAGIGAGAGECAAVTGATVGWFPIVNTNVWIPGSPNNAALGASPGHLLLVDCDQVAQFARIDGARS
jgi:hypothetical protein